MSTIKVIALPSTGWNYTGEQSDFMDRIRNCNPNGYYVINGFTDANDLKTKIQNIIDNDGSYPALELLEIWCHGHNGRIDGITTPNTNVYGQALKSITSWTDEASIYLSGCNTGLTPRSVAKALAAEIKFEAGQFEHKITVYGAAGYLYGFNGCNNTRTECTYIRRGEKVKKFFAFVWGVIKSGGSLLQGALEAGTVDVEFKPFAGCRDASGAASYNAFKNWS